MHRLEGILKETLSFRDTLMVLRTVGSVLNHSNSLTLTTMTPVTLAILSPV